MGIDSAATTKVRGSLIAAAQGLALALLALTASIVLFVLTVVSLALIPIGVGVLTTPYLIDLVRAHATTRRKLAYAWSGVEIPVPYRRFPADLRTGFVGHVERLNLMLKDPATWRDLLWLLTDMTAGAVTAILAPGLLVEGLFGTVLFAGLWTVLGDWWYAFIPVQGWGTAFLASLLGLVWITLGLLFNPYLVRAHFAVAAASLSPTRKARLDARIDQLTESRHDAVDASAAELRRIERDLHDGAQARLVAMGMDLGTIEALVEKNPAKAKELLAQARQNSADALTELRDLVRGIHPPVLAERGLGDAVQALALRLPVPTEVAVALPGRLEAPVESAAYFAVSEVLTNAVKHADAERIWVDIEHRAGMLRIAVTDNGRGGADVSAGSGLRGVERRLGTFDGVLAVSSPAGGPTMVTMEIPCASS
ncbi:sensor domain-containing protein [Streptomyces sp. TRM66268-LWL]|uniref:histidine kinase n=1 Tax=Streptomyces polyasparticus TaxID=2767826 RepID=A0ABR7SA86_9ACTN|nr:histidine kinase [Streptomyces polyasparticus]MBC9712381.1 sensor domain-containing protein [Streptomyces polyasparticus]